MKDNIMVTVLIAAYNHEKFIEDAIEGIINQKTDFKYELLIHDDASADRTPEIIREYELKYPEIVKGIFQEVNQFQHCHLGSVFLHPRIRGKYIALCDGDDYWTDEKKLQKQVDFLEANEEYSMCMHNAVKVNYETGEKKIINTFPETGTYGQKEQILAGLGTDFPASASYVLRAELFQEIPAFFFETRALDYPIRQYFANRGKVYYFAEPMSVYRVSTPRSYMKSTRKQQIFYNNYTLEMIHFFERFDNYTKRKFHDLLKEKIKSDYFGYCTSINREDGIKKAEENGLDPDKVIQCYQCVSEEYLSSDILKLQKTCDALFIYGISRISEFCKKQLEYAGISYQGYVVSDGQPGQAEVEGKKVYYLSDVLSEYSNPGFILAVQPVNVEAIAAVLQSHNIRNYCKPYTL